MLICRPFLVVFLCEMCIFRTKLSRWKLNKIGTQLYIRIEINIVQGLQMQINICLGVRSIIVVCQYFLPYTVQKLKICITYPYVSRSNFRICNRGKTSLKFRNCVHTIESVRIFYIFRCFFSFNGFSQTDFYSQIISFYSNLW